MKPEGKSPLAAGNYVSLGILRVFGLVSEVEFTAKS